MPTTALLIQDCDRLTTSTPLFRLSLAQNMDDLVACQRLRYLVFNCELGEGLADSHWVGGDPLELQPYGYAAWDPRQGTLMLRNPDDQPHSILLDAASVFELPAGFSAAMRP